MKKYEKLYPQLVEVVNELKAKIETSESAPLNVSLPADIIWGSGGSRSVRTYSANTATWVFAKPSVGNYNVHVAAVYVKDSATGFVTVVPIGADYYNLSVAQIGLMENNFHNLNVLYPSTSPAKVVYTRIGNDMEAETIVYSLQ